MHFGRQVCVLCVYILLKPCFERYPVHSKENMFIKEIKRLDKNKKCFYTGSNVSRVLLPEYSV